ncbi:hypothetical protein BpHYR1_049368 [Brachionus plicatilis]|uniref:Uncharacterized protein n=1 Tax=Brachionus plicatilis TaxID=10195 RepID=A0A3M7SRD1_BRAPC|nr:hypothetical protein BpHYR1_049368 [Brachionus plicatilis]
MSGSSSVGCTFESAGSVDWDSSTGWPSRTATKTNKVTSSLNGADAHKSAFFCRSSLKMVEKIFSSENFSKKFLTYLLKIEIY